MVGVYLVQILSAGELIHHIKDCDENILGVESSRNLIQAYISKFSGVQASALSLSLQCPFDRTLIQTPARGTLCEHIQCFSLENYVRIMEKISPRKWRCPICKFKCFHFQIDSYQHMILNTIRKYKLDLAEITFDDKANITSDQLRALLKTEEIEKEKQPIFSLKQKSQVVISLDSDPEPNLTKKPKLTSNMITIE